MGIKGEVEVTETIVEVRQCPVDHVYDPFVQNCRRIRCRPGTQFENGACVDIEGYVEISTTTAVTTTTSGGMDTDPPVIDNPILEEIVDDEDDDTDVDEVTTQHDYDPGKGYMTPEQSR